MTRRTTLPEPWLSLAESYGSIKELAHAIGVAPRTVARWASGDRTPGIIVRRHVDAMAKKRGVAAPFGG